MIQMRSKSWLSRSQVIKAVHEAALEPTRRCALAVEREAKSGMSGRGNRKGGKSSHPGQAPAVRSGLLRSSIRSAHTWTGTYLIGPTRLAWYGRIQEFGGVIRPKKAKALAVPVDDASYGKNPGDFPSLVMIKFPNAKCPVLIDTNTAKVMFLLLKSVHIPARPFMRPALYRAINKFPGYWKDIDLGDTPAGRALNRSQARAMPS